MLFKMKKHIPKKAEKIRGTKQAAVYLKGIQKKIYEAAEAIAS